MKRMCSGRLCHLLVMAALGLMTVPAQAQTPHFSFELGGILNGELRAPQGVAVSPSGNIYLADTANNRIQVFDSQGNFLFKFGSFLSGGEGFFRAPAGVAVDPNTGHVVAAASSVQVFDSQGNLLFKLAIGGDSVAVDPTTGNILTG